MSGDEIRDFPRAKTLLVFSFILVCVLFAT